MNKTIPIMSRTIICPKCGNKTLRASVETVPEEGREYFCDHDHLYFSLENLILYWNYTKVDFQLDIFAQQVTEDEEYEGYDEWEEWWEDDEPVFLDLDDRNQSYELVDRMFNEVDEWELDGTTNDGVDIGATHV